MKPKQLIPFILILLVLVGLVMFKQSKTEKSSIVKQANLATLVPDSLKKDAVTRVELYKGKANTERVVLAKNGDAWSVTSNFNAPVTKDTIDKYLDMALAIKGERRDTATEDSKMASYELKDDQAFHVEIFTGADKAAFHLLVGKAPDSHSVFLRTADSKDVYVESKDLRKEAGVTGTGDEAKLTATHWFDKDIIKIEQARIKKVSLTMPDKALVLERVEKPAEPAVTPAADPANPTATPPAPAADAKPTFTWQLASGGPGIPLKEPGVDSILQKIATFVATDIVDPAKKADWGLETPAFKAEITLEGDETLVLEAGLPDPAGDAYVRLASSGKDIVYQVNKFNFERLFAKGSQLFDLPKQPIPVESIDGVEVSAPGSVLVLRKEGEWKLLAPATDMQLQTSAVNNLVSTLANLTPADYADDTTDIGEVTHTVTVTAGGQNSVLRIAGKCKSSDGNYVLVGDSGKKLVISQNDIAKIMIQPKDVIDRKIFNVEVGKVTNVDITHNDAAFSLAKNGDSWTKLSAGGVSTPIETSLVENFLFGLDEMQVSDLKPGVDPASLQYNTTATIIFSEGEPIVINASHKDNVDALLSTNVKTGVFSVEPMSLNALTGPIIALRDVAGPAPAMLQSPQSQIEPADPSAPTIAPATETPSVAPVTETPTVAPATETPSAEPAPVVIQSPAPESAPAN